MKKVCCKKILNTAVRYNVVSLLRIGGGAGPKYWTSPASHTLYLSQYHNINCINTQAQILHKQILQMQKLMQILQIEIYKYTTHNDVSKHMHKCFLK